MMKGIFWFVFKVMKWDEKRKSSVKETCKIKF